MHCRILKHLVSCVSCTLLLLCCVSVDAASLWQAKTIAEGTPYSDRLARKPGDLLTINVQETTKVSERQKTSTSRENDASISGTISPATADARATPGLGISSEKEFEGIGKHESSGDVRATITARVTSVLDNGNLVIEGRRSIKINANTKVILISGIIRPVDVSSENTVRSERIHNFRVGIEGEGPLTRAQQQGLLSRLFDIIWPF